MTAVDEHWLVQELIADGCARAAAGNFVCHAERSERSERLLEVGADVFPHLVMPVRPFVTALRSPVVQMMSNTAIPENLRHSVGRPAVLPGTTAGYQPDIT